MIPRLLIPVLASVALVSAAAWAQSAVRPTDSVSPPSTDSDGSQNLVKKIHDELTAQGFKDVKVVPNSFIVSGKDKDGKPMMMLIGPGTMTMLTPADPDDSPTAPNKDGDKDGLIQE